MLHVAALFVAGAASMDEHGAIAATNIPTTSFETGEIPLRTEIPVVLVVHARSGSDYDPQVHVVCKNPTGTPAGAFLAEWHWPDDGDNPSKYRCFTQQLAVDIEAAGEYTIGAYYDENGVIEMATPIPFSVNLA
jgi:hypothetical protein